MEEVSEKFKDIMANREKVEKRYDAKARREFSRPALTCQFCGQSMTEHEDAGINRWQQRWSIHHECANAVDDRLDRSIGIKSERQS